MRSFLGHIARELLSQTRPLASFAWLSESGRVLHRVSVISNYLLTAGIDPSPIPLNSSPTADPCNLTVSLSAELDTQEQGHQATPLMCLGFIQSDGRRQRLTHHAPLLVPGSSGHLVARLP